jgi:hypothetical protein
MNATDKLDATATETLIRFLAQRFIVKMPRLHISNRSANHGTYSSRRNRICLSRNAETWVVAHEFAHHLDKIRNGETYHRRLYLPGTHWRRPHTKDIWHGEGFYYTLRNVIEAIGCVDYPWTREYKRLARWARRDGLA